MCKESDSQLILRKGVWGKWILCWGYSRSWIALAAINVCGRENTCKCHVNTIGGKKIYLYPNALAEQMPLLIKEKYLGSTFFFFCDQIFELSFSTFIFRVCGHVTQHIDSLNAEIASQHFWNCVQILIPEIPYCDWFSHNWPVLDNIMNAF